MKKKKQTKEKFSRHIIVNILQAKGKKKKIFPLKFHVCLLAEMLIDYICLM